MKGTAVTREEALRGYRVWLFGQGEENEGTRADGRPMRRGMAPEEVAAVVEAKRQVSSPPNEKPATRLVSALLLAPHFKNETGCSGVQGL